MNLTEANAVLHTACAMFDAPAAYAEASAIVSAAHKGPRLAAVRAAMGKAGVSATFDLVSDSFTNGWGDVAGWRVVCDDKAVALRIAAFLVAWEEKHGSRKHGYSSQAAYSVREHNGKVFACTTYYPCE